MILFNVASTNIQNYVCIIVIHMLQILSPISSSWLQILHMKEKRAPKVLNPTKTLDYDYFEY